MQIVPFFYKIRVAHCVPYNTFIRQQHNSFTVTAYGKHQSTLRHGTQFFKRLFLQILLLQLFEFLNTAQLIFICKRATVCYHMVFFVPTTLPINSCVFCSIIHSVHRFINIIRACKNRPVSRAVLCSNVLLLRRLHHSRHSASAHWRHRRIVFLDVYDTCFCCKQ